MVEESALNGWENLFQTIKFEKLKRRKNKNGKMKKGGKTIRKRKENLWK